MSTFYRKKRQKKQAAPPKAPGRGAHPKPKKKPKKESR